MKVIDENSIVIVIEAEAHIRELIVRILKRLGIAAENIFQATNGDDGWTLIQQKPCKLIITDFRMEGLNGAEIIRKTRNIHPLSPLAIPIILITANPNGSIPSGYNHLLIKPFSIELLTAILEDCLPKKQVAGE